MRRAPRTGHAFIESGVNVVVGLMHVSEGLGSGGVRGSFALGPLPKFKYRHR